MNRVYWHGTISECEQNTLPLLCTHHTEVLDRTLTSGRRTIMCRWIECMQSYGKRSARTGSPGWVINVLNPDGNPWSSKTAGQAWRMESLIRLGECVCQRTFLNTVQQSCAAGRGILHADAMKHSADSRSMRDCIGQNYLTLFCQVLDLELGTNSLKLTPVPRL
jgi:hypothetical protein